MKRSDLVRRLAARGGWTAVEAARMIDEVFGTLVTALRGGARAELRGFGVFRVKQRQARRTRDINTGGELRIRPHRTIVFRAGRELQAALNRPEEQR